MFIHNVCLLFFHTFKNINLWCINISLTITTLVSISAIGTFCPKTWCEYCVLGLKQIVQKNVHVLDLDMDYQWLMFISLSSSSSAEKAENLTGSQSKVRRLTRQAVWVLLKSGIVTRRTSWPLGPGGKKKDHQCKYSVGTKNIFCSENDLKLYLDRKWMCMSCFLVSLLVNIVVFSNTCQGTVPVRCCSYFSSERFCHTKSLRTEPVSISTFLSVRPLQKRSVAHLMPVFNHKLWAISLFL